VSKIKKKKKAISGSKHKRRNTADKNDKTESPEARGAMLSLKRAQMKLTGGKRPGAGPEYSAKRKPKRTGRKTTGAAEGQSEEDDASENDDVVEFKIKEDESEGARQAMLLPRIDEAADRARKQKAEAELSESSYSGFQGAALGTRAENASFMRQLALAHKHDPEGWKYAAATGDTSGG
jgi:hypothetical protein